MSLTKIARDAALAIGAHVPPSALTKIGNLVRDLELRAWLRRYGLDDAPIVDTRDELFCRIADNVSDKPTRYLEFGVAEGAATRRWSALLRHPQTTLHGFDCFEGLPEAWLPDRPK